MERYPLVSIYTCVYNGERTLSRVFSSLKNMDYPNIEHVIVNDGSDDKTDEMILEYINQVPFVVKYHKQENGGKHSALNVAWDLSEGEFLIQLDADDELYPHSIKFLVDTYYSIPEDIREQYWCVHGRYITQNGNFVGDLYPDDINNFHWSKSVKIARKCTGDKIGIQVRKYLCNYRFPEVIGVSHIPESIVWNQIDKKYGTWYTNEIVGVNYVNEGGNLTARRTHRKQFGSLCYWNKWKLMHPEEYEVSWKDFVLYSLCYFVTIENFRKNNHYTKDLPQYKIALLLFAPVAYIGSIALRIVKKLK